MTADSKNTTIQESKAAAKVLSCCMRHRVSNFTSVNLGTRTIHTMYLYSGLSWLLHPNHLFLE